MLYCAWIKNIQGPRVCIIEYLDSMTWYCECGFCSPGQVAQLLESYHIHQKVAGSIPSHGTYLGCGFDSWSWSVWETTDWCFSLISVFLSLSPPSSPFQKSIKTYPWMRIKNKRMWVLHSIFCSCTSIAIYYVTLLKFLNALLLPYQ